MFRRSSQEPLRIEIDERTYAFADPRDLEFALAGRTAVPAGRVAALIDLDDDALFAEAEAVRQVEKRFADALSRSLEGLSNVGEFLDRLNPALISKDQQWRDIVEGLTGLGRAFEPYKKIAMVKYMQYLTARQEVVNTLCRTREIRPAAPGAGDHDEHGAGPGDDLSEVESRSWETSVIDLSLVARGGRRRGFTRIPKGETVEIPLHRDQRVSLMIAKHPCSIVLSEGLVFVDDQGRDSPLPRGKSVVGRDVGNDVVLNGTYRDVSRRHLIVETDGQSFVRLTDISSHGTSVPPDCLRSTSI